MDFLVLSRSVDGAEPDDALTERHWSYMDRYADGMTARGPTLSPDRETWTGSMHVVALPSPVDVRDFVAEEPYDGAGMFESHRTWRFTNLLGRTMWDGARTGDQTFLVLSPEALDLSDDCLLMHGELRSMAGEANGYAAAVQLPDASSLRGVGAEVHDWEPGGRR